MKKSGIIFFELTLIILLFACTTDKAVLNHHVTREKSLHIAWDPVPKPASIDEGSEIKYCVYICTSESNDKKEAVAVRKSVKNTEFKEDTPIADTSCIIEFPPTEDIFVIGVQTVVCEKEETIVCDPAIENNNRSEIAWSDNPIYTNYHPFDVRYGAK